MLGFSVFLYLLVSFGVMGMGIKYIRTAPPLSYHAKITKADKLSVATLRVLGSLYKVMGGSFLALGVMLVVLTLFGVWNDVLWAKLTILVGSLIAGSIAVTAPRELEQVTGVRTPWRIAALLTILTTIAFGMSVL